MEKKNDEKENDVFNHKRRRQELIHDPRVSSSTSSALSSTSTSPVKATIHLLDLADVVISHICSFLPSTTHPAFKQTSVLCWRIAKLTSSTPHDVTIYQGHEIGLDHNSGRYPRLARLRIGHFHREDEIRVMQSIQFSSITALYVEDRGPPPFTKSIYRELFPGLKQLRIHGLSLPSTSGEELADLFGLLVDLTSLDLGAMSSEVLTQIPSSQLRSLKIDFLYNLDEPRSQLQDLHNVLTSKFTSLTKLDWRIPTTMSQLILLSTGLPHLQSLRLNLYQTQRSVKEESKSFSEVLSPVEAKSQQVLFPNLTSLDLTNFSYKRPVAPFLAPKLESILGIDICEAIHSSGDWSRFPLLTSLLRIHGTPDSLSDLCKITSLQQTCTELSLDLHTGLQSPTRRDYSPLSLFIHLTSLTITCTESHLHLPLLPKLRLLDLRDCCAEIIGSYSNYPSLTALYTSPRTSSILIDPMINTSYSLSLASLHTFTSFSDLRLLDLSATRGLVCDDFIHLLGCQDHKGDIKASNLNPFVCLQDECLNVKPLPRLQVICIRGSIRLSTEAERLILYHRMLVLQKKAI